MIFDTHLHTFFSADSEMKLEAAKERANSLGIGFITTEHLDLNAPNYADFSFDFDTYFATYGPQRSDRLLLGIEIGMRPCCLEEVRQRLKGKPFDYVIGSIHIVDDLDIYYDVYYQGKTKAEAYTSYFTAMETAVQTYDFIDALGHIDYIARYGKYAEPEIYYHEFKDSIDRVLAAAAARDLALEINTRRFSNLHTMKELAPIYRRFKEVGGKFVTIGSDAHRPEAIGAHFSLALEFADACGLQPIYFKERRKMRMRK